MPRSRVAMAVLALTTLVLCAGAEAADWSGAVLLAQSVTVPRGTGFYLNLLKFLPVLAVFLLWTWTTGWADDDMRELNNIRFEMWNSVLFFTGILGFVLVWAIPFYIIGLLLLLVAYFVPLFTYI